MWKTFKAELKHIFSNKWRVAGWFMLLFIPFTYGFLYMNAYWAPFKHVDELKIAVVSRDLEVDSSGNVKTDSSGNTIENAISKNLSDTLVKDGLTAGANQIYNVVRDNKVSDNPMEAVDSGKYAAVIVIPNGYSKAMKQFEDAILASIIPAVTGSTTGSTSTGTSTLTPTPFSAKLVIEEFEKARQIMKSAASTGPNSFDKVSFYYSYKHSYLAGEMTNFISNNAELVLRSLFPTTAATIHGTNTGIAFSIIHKLINGIVGTIPKVELVNKYGHENFNSYGSGLAPYFLSIALWAGALATLFVVKNERHIKTESTVKHMFGKLAVWIMTGWIQAIILVTAVTLQGVRVGGGLEDQWRLFAFAFFMATIFPTIVMFTAYTMRFGDMGEFLIVILLVAQLISSSGTFPVEMQNIIFKIIHPIAPFTYTISSIREIMWDTDITTLFVNMAILLAFPAVVMPLSIYINYRFDKKNVTEIKGINNYESFEIHLGDY